MTRRGRDKFLDVGNAARLAIERANASKLSDGDHRTLLAVIDLTLSWSRLCDEVYVADVRQRTGPSEETRLHERTVRTCLVNLAARRIVGWEPRRGTDASGKGFPSKLSLPHQEVVEQTGPPEQTERLRGPVSSAGQTGRTPGDRVKQDLLGPEDLEQEGFLETSRVCAREAGELLEETDAAIERSREIRAGKLPEREQEVVDAVFAAFPGAREIVGPRPPGRVLERVEGCGVVVELVAVTSRTEVP